MKALIILLALQSVSARADYSLCIPQYSMICVAVKDSQMPLFYDNGEDDYGCGFRHELLDASDVADWLECSVTNFPGK